MPHKASLKRTTGRRSLRSSLARRVRWKSALHYRRHLGIPVIGITGTAGKTTTKEMIRSILSVSHHVVATPANLNANPAKTIFRASPKTEVLVMEVGMDKPGMIAWQCRIIEPDIGVITNIGHAHVESCGGFLGVLRAKNELVYGLRSDGVLVLNADDPGTRFLRLTEFGGRIVRFGRNHAADYRLVETDRTRSGWTFRVAAEGEEHECSLRLPGEHAIHDALAAIAATRALHAPWDDIRRGLSRYRPIHGRQLIRRGIRGCLVIDDAYNANPLSVRAGLRTLHDVAGERPTIAVLGNLEEQGSGWMTVHRTLGQEVVEAKVDSLVTVGHKAAQIAVGAVYAGLPHTHAHTAATRSRAWHVLLRQLKPDSVVLVKGSHSTGLGKLVQLLCRPTRQVTGRRAA